MNDWEALQAINSCLRRLDADYTVCVSWDPLEDAVFFVQNGFLWVGGQDMKIACTQITSIRCKCRRDHPLGDLLIYYHAGAVPMRLCIAFDQNSRIVRLQKEPCGEPEQNAMEPWTGSLTQRNPFP